MGYEIQAKQKYTITNTKVDNIYNKSMYLKNKSTKFLLDIILWLLYSQTCKTAFGIEVGLL